MVNCLIIGIQIVLQFSVCIQGIELQPFVMVSDLNGENVVAILIEK
jgi:hypothetical protein